MRNSKRVISFGTGKPIGCTWCAMHGHDKPGYELHKHTACRHPVGFGGWSCDDPRSEHIHYVFCTERHRLYFMNSHRDMGNLPAGFRTVT